MMQLVILFVTAIGRLIRNIAKLFYKLCKPIGDYGYKKAVTEAKKQGMSEDAAKALISAVILGWIITVIVFLNMYF